MIGKQLSHYHISAELGRGGMGIVYRATDTKLNRDVALKILPAAALASEDDRARFFREAQAAAQLHHPNIATVFEIDEAILVDESGAEVGATDGPRPFIAMELVDGETLHDLIKKGPLPLQKAVNIAGQIAEALKAAHEKEIVHRDIKSANVMITSDGVAKVLDFGLAKTNQSTMLTRMGTTLGTVSFMSPEQARGQAVDGRSDLYSLGTVMYEMVAGRLPFVGDYEQAILYSILNETPESLTGIRAGVPMQLDWLVMKLLSKEAEYRYQSAAGLLADLKSLDLGGSGQSRRSRASVSTPSIPRAAQTASGIPKWIWAGLAGVAAVFLAIGWLVKPTPEENRDTTVRRFTLDLPSLSFAYGLEVSRDGKTLAMGAPDSTGNSGGLFLVDLETSLIHKVPGITWGGTPRISPNQDRLLFSRRGGRIYTVPLTGGTEYQIDSNSRGAAWLLDGSIVYQKENVLWLRESSAEAARPITTLDSLETYHGAPFALPDGRHVIFHVGFPEESRLHLSMLDLKTGKRTDVGIGSHPRYLESGHLLYGDGSAAYDGPLMLRPFDLQTLAFSGSEVTWRHEARVGSYNVDSYGTWYDMIYLTSEGGSDTKTLYRFDNDGQNPVKLFEGDVENPKLSPDGDRIALSVTDGDDEYVMILDLKTGVEQQITFSGEAYPYAWSSDGDQIMLVQDGSVAIYSSHGLGLERTLPIENATWGDWSRDGRYVVYVNAISGGGPLHLYDLETDRDTLFEASGAYFPRFSPDGRYVAYSIGTADGVNSFVRSTTGTGYVPLSLEEPLVRRPVWSKDGTSIYVAADPDQIVRVPVDISDAFRQTGRGEAIVSLNDEDGFDVAADGSVFILTDDALDEPGRSQGEDSYVRLSVIVNWFEQVKQMAPPAK